MAKLAPRILSPSEAKEVLTIPCLLLLGGVAKLVFPTSTRSTPSVGVWIVRTSPQDVSGRSASLTGSLPVVVDWRQWKTAVVPVLEDESWRLTAPVLAGMLMVGEAPSLVNLFGEALRASFVAAGWGPQGT